MLPNAVPSIFTFRKDTAPSRTSRYTPRHDIVDNSVVDDVQMEVVIGEESGNESSDEMVDGIEPLQMDKGEQCSLIGTFCIDSFINDHKRVKLYTSFENYNHFMLFFNCLGPAVLELNCQCLSLHPKDQLF